jgi:hypothetical protein
MGRRASRDVDVVNQRFASAACPAAPSFMNAAPPKNYLPRQWGWFPRPQLNEKQLEEDGAQRVDVRPSIQRDALVDLLRRHAGLAVEPVPLRAREC